jgi:hypothetical protein
MRSEAEFGRICLADDDCTRAAQTGHHQIIRLCHLICKQRRAHRRRQPRCIGQILNRNGHAMQPPAARQIVSLACSIAQTVPVAQADNRVHRRVYGLDTGQRSVHQLKRRHLTCFKRSRLSARVHVQNIHATTKHVRPSGCNSPRFEDKCFNLSSCTQMDGWPIP